MSPRVCQITLVAIWVALLVAGCSGNEKAVSTSNNKQATKVNSSEPQCDPNYSGCVPIASDVDCEGGNGNGPAYVKGPIRVIGRDIYGLDRDGNGIACEELLVNKKAK